MLHTVAWKMQDKIYLVVKSIKKRISLFLSTNCTCQCCLAVLYVLFYVFSLFNCNVFFVDARWLIFLTHENYLYLVTCTGKANFSVSYNLLGAVCPNSLKIVARWLYSGRKNPDFLKFRMNVNTLTLLKWREILDLQYLY